VGSLLRIPPSPRQIDPDAEFPFRRDEELPTFVIPASLVYWVIFSLATGAGWAGYVFYDTTAPTHREFIEGAIVMLLLLPGVQLLASLLAFGVVAVLPRTVQPDRRVGFIRLGLILAWSFVGTLAGIGVMVLLASVANNM
jgi:hypothetical protein